MNHEHLTIVGNVGRQPDLKYTQAGKPVCSFSVAVSQGNNKPAKWFKVTAWEALAEQCHTYLRKGQTVLVTGRIDASAYLDKSGQPAASLELTASTVRFGDGGERQSPDETTDDYAPPPDDVSDIPF